MADFDPALVPRASAFLASLQQAIDGSDRTVVANMLRYPVRVTGLHGVNWITTPSQFMAHYSAIMTKRVKNAIKTQTTDCLFANWQGVMIGNGEVWAEATPASKPLKVTTFNLR